jgi:ABC-2 type transport system permease protein
MNREIKITESPGISSQLPKILTMGFYSLRAQLRNPATFAFGFVFPIVFISVFGLIGNGSGTTVKIGVPRGSSEQTKIFQNLKKVSSIKITQGDINELRNELTRGKLDGLLIIEETNVPPTLDPKTEKASSSFPVSNLVLEITNANPQNSAAAKTFISAVVDKANLEILAGKNLPVKLETKEISGREYRFIDFALPGQIGFAILSTAIFGTAFGLIFLKKTLVLKRIFATPTRPISIILGQGLARLMSTILQTLLILAFGVIIFKFHLANGWITFLEMLFLSCLGLIVFLGFGLFISGISADENAVAPLANLITLPQFLLSGTFFSTDVFPSWVRAIANQLPLTYLNDAMRKVATEGAGITDIWFNIFALVIWAVIAYFAASRTFKWQ